MIPFMTTYTGLKVNPLDLKPKDICIADIAHHLALINRFVGATREPISVARHSINVMFLVRNTEYMRDALFHDASEAYLGDVSRWVKRSPCMEEYRRAEEKAKRAIAKALDIHAVTPDCVDEADRLMVRYEASQGISNPEHLYAVPGFGPLSPEEFRRIPKWNLKSWKQIEKEFLYQAEALGY